MRSGRGASASEAPGGPAASLRDELRGLARRYGTPALVAACADLVEELALRGVAAELAARRAEAGAEERCPRCRANDAVIAETMQLLRRTAPPPPEGRPADETEE